MALSLHGPLGSGYRIMKALISQSLRQPDTLRRLGPPPLRQGLGSVLKHQRPRTVVLGHSTTVSNVSVQQHQGPLL